MNRKDFLVKSTVYPDFLTRYLTIRKENSAQAVFEITPSEWNELSPGMQRYW